MKLSNFFIPTQKETPSEAKIPSHKLMIRSGMIRMELSGIYSWLPLGFKVINKIQKIIEKKHEEKNINQILMPTIQSAEIWKISNRYESYGKEMLRITDRNNKELLYGPTNEEMITLLGSDYIRSYKSLPINLFHIQTKFRDEIRPRFGVMRAREFIMKDAYSFDKDKDSGIRTYEMFFNLYLDIFKNLGVDIIPVKALSGEIGGDLSHEFHLISKGGESEIKLDRKLNFSDNKKLDYKDFSNYFTSTTEYFEADTENNFEVISKKSIELGHIFLFGDKYSKSFNFKINSTVGSLYPYMGSYGIGLSRIPAAIIENNFDDKGIIWPKEISPFDLIILNLQPDNVECIEFSNKIYNDLKSKGIDALYDDRKDRVGVKFSDADLIGIPLQIIIGREYIENSVVQIKERSTGKEYNFKKTEALNKILQKLKL